MPTRARNVLRTDLRRIFTSSITNSPKFLNPFELTKSSWATQINSRVDIPDVYKSFFELIPEEEYEFPYTVLTPSYENFIHKTTEKLISDFGHDIYVLERRGNTFETQCYPISGISYIEMRIALLASSFEIRGLTYQGDYASSILKFNSVTDYLFTPILRRVRPVTVESKDVIKSTEIEKFDCLADVNFKFMNLAKRSLLEGEKIVQFILQPEIQEKVLTFLNRSYDRTISATHMSILTDCELIVIWEDITQRKEDRYGAIWDYMPLKKIKSLSVGEKADNLLGLNIQLSEGMSFEFLFQTSAKDELNQLLTRFEELSAQ